MTTAKPATAALGTLLTLVVENDSQEQPESEHVNSWARWTWRNVGDEEGPGMVATLRFLPIPA
jgi:hypothetical protein